MERVYSYNPGARTRPTRAEYELYISGGSSPRLTWIKGHIMSLLLCYLVAKCLTEAK